MDLVAELDLDLLALAGHPHIRAAQLAQKVQRRLRLLAQRQAQGVLAAALGHRLLHVVGHPVEAVRGIRALDALVGALVVVVGHPVVQALGRIREGREDGVVQKFRPDRLPEALDLAQRHRVLGSAADVPDPLAHEHFLKLTLAPPCHELAAVVAQDLPRRSPLADRALDDLQHRIRLLLAVQAVTHDVPAVIVDDPDQVDPVHPLQLEGEDVDLPKRVGHRPLEATDLGRTPASFGRRLTQVGLVDHAAHRLGTDREAFIAAELVADAADAVLRMGLPVGLDAILERHADPTRR